MYIVLLIIIIILSTIIVIQYIGSVNKNKEITYITEKIEEIIKDSSAERIKLLTGDVKLQGLMININRLLDKNCEDINNYNKTKLSMKKMLSNISHDLKTPLTVILGYIEILKLKSDEKVMADKIYIKATEVLNLINKFFDLSKLESGDKHIEMTRVNISEVCRKAILIYYDALDREGIQGEVNIPEKDIFVHGNEEAISRVLDNLISNAIKYGGDGGYLGLILREGDGVTVEVVDKGKGIEETYKEEVFERMYTLEDSRSRLYRGSGLGLTITKALIKSMNGEIHLSSTPNVKTVFAFTLNKLTT